MKLEFRMNNNFSHHFVPYTQVIEYLKHTYQLNDDQAKSIWHLGDSENQEKTIDNHIFYSGHRSEDMTDEYYIPIFGPKGFEFVRYHYEG